jgi:hypothetical protein
MRGRLGLARMLCVIRISQTATNDFQMPDMSNPVRRSSALSLALVAALSLGLVGAPSHAKDEAPVTAAPPSAKAKGKGKAATMPPLPQNVIDQWPALKAQPAMGRLVKIEPRPVYAALSPCTISVQLCKMTEPLLEVGTIEVAEKDGQSLRWLVFLPIPQKAKVGEYLVFDFPDTPKEIGQARYDFNDKLGKPKCTWGEKPELPGVKGAICEEWNFTQAPYKW